MIVDTPLFPLYIKTEKSNMYMEMYPWKLSSRDIFVILQLIKLISPKTILATGIDYGHWLYTIAIKNPHISITCLDDTIRIRKRLFTGQYPLGIRDDDIGCVVDSLQNINIIKHQFLRCTFIQKFDCIILCSDEVEDDIILQTKKAFSLLNDNGIIIWYGVNDIPYIGEKLSNIVNNDIYYIEQTKISFSNSDISIFNPSDISIYKEIDNRPVVNKTYETLKKMQTNRRRYMNKI